MKRPKPAILLSLSVDIFEGALGGRYFYAPSLCAILTLNGDDCSC